VSIIVSEYNDYFTFVNNVVTEGYYIGISVSDHSHHVTVVNNIFYNNYEADPDSRRGQALTDDTCHDGSEWDYNIHYPDFTWPEKQPQYDVNGQFGVDPLFVDAPGADYHLAAGSPAIDQGLTLSGFDYDKDGVMRPQGSAWDIGAYEYCDGPCVGGGGGAGGAGAGGSGGTGGTAGAGGSTPPGASAPEDDSGCGCRLPARSAAAQPAWLLLLACAALAARARRRARPAQR
jgi:hypothetical protein